MRWRAVIPRFNREPQRGPLRFRYQAGAWSLHRPSRPLPSQSREIELGELYRPDLSGLDEPREVCEGKERQLLVRSGPRYNEGSAPEWPPLGGDHL